MSTFKIPPVYAETLFRMLDATTVVDALTAEDVLRAHDWNFEGGKFGERPDDEDAAVEVMRETSETVLPHGNSRAMAEAMKKAREDAEDAGRTVKVDVPKELRMIMNNRQETRRTTWVEAMSWATVYAYATANGSTIITGMPAVYAVANLVVTDCHARKGYRAARSKFARTVAVANELVIGCSAGAGLSLAHTRANAATAYAMMETYRVPEMMAAESETKRLLRDMAMGPVSTDMKNAADELDDLEEMPDDLDDIDFPNFASHHKIVGTIGLKVFPRCAVLRAGKKSHVLGMSDWRKVIIFITGVKNYIAGCCADACAGGVAKVAAASRTVSCVYMSLRDVAAAGSRLAVGEHIEMCKTYKSMLAVVKATRAGDRASVHAAELHADMRATSVYAKVKKEVDACLARIESLTPRAALAAAKLFRLMPPGDVWLAEALLQRSIKGAIVHRVAREDIDLFKVALREVILTAKAHSKKVSLDLIAPNNPPAWWADYKSGKVDMVPKSELIDHVAWRGQVEMADRSRYDPSVWKDSALGQDSLAKAMAAQMDPHSRNMLKMMLFDDKCPMPDETLTVVEEISAVMLKPEGHKKRIAYMNHMASRLHQSLCELTVSDVMASHPSFAPVKTGSERDIAFEKLASPPPSTNAIPMSSQYAGAFWVALLYSFDISGWSENMPIDIQTASHEVWDEFTGTDNFSKTTANHYRAKVYCNNAGVKAWYTNGGANFEGYNGKEMTALHVAMMTMAVKELRRRLPDVPAHMLQILLQAYIDDGIAKMTVPSTIAKRVFDEWETVVGETWAKYGFAIEAKKSFPSYFYFEFLGEEFYAGIQLASGTKATMRIMAEPPDYWETLPTRVSKIASACRGASTAGMEPLGAIVVQALFAAVEVAKWVDISDAPATAFWMMVPRSLGGLGMPALIPQSANASGAAVEEGMANLKEWATKTASPSVKKAYVALVRGGFRDRTAAEMMGSPLGGASESGVMRGNPIALVTRDGLKELAAVGKLSKLGCVMTSLADPEPTVALAEATLDLEPSTIIQEAALEDLAAPTLSKIGDAFLSRFEKESTFLELAPRSRLRAIERLNRADAKASKERMYAFAR